MKMTMVLLMAAVALLVGTDAATLKPTDKSLVRNRIINITEGFNEKQEEFVPDVEPLAFKCGSEFFCKVSDILDNKKTASTWTKKEALVENLKEFHKHENVNCTEMLKNVQPNGVHIPMKAVLNHLIRCMKHKNLLPLPTKKSSS